MLHLVYGIAALASVVLMPGNSVIAVLTMRDFIASTHA